MPGEYSLNSLPRSRKALVPVALALQHHLASHLCSVISVAWSWGWCMVVSATQDEFIPPVQLPPPTARRGSAQLPFFEVTCRPSPLTLPPLGPRTQHNEYLVTGLPSPLINKTFAFSELCLLPGSQCQAQCMARGRFLVG